MEVSGVKLTVSFPYKHINPVTYDLCNLQVTENGIVNVFYDREEQKPDGYVKHTCLDAYKMADVLKLSIDRVIEERVTEDNVVPLFSKGEDDEQPGTD